MTDWLADLNVSKATLTIDIKTLGRHVTSTVNVPLDCRKVHGFTDQLMILRTPTIVTHAVMLVLGLKAKFCGLGLAIGWPWP